MFYPFPPPGRRRQVARLRHRRYSNHRHLPGISDLNGALGHRGFILDWRSILSAREGPPLPDPAEAACNAMMGG